MRGLCWKKINFMGLLYNIIKVMVCDLFIYVFLGQVYVLDLWVFVICKLMQFLFGFFEKEQSLFKLKWCRIM